MSQSPVVYLNGEFLPLEQAKVSVLDRGFLFGDGVYEVIPVYGGKLFRLEHHLERLNSSLQKIRISLPFTVEEWTSILKKIITSNEGEDQSVYLQITRGSAPKRDHGFPAKVQPTILVMSNPLLPIDPSIAANGVKAITMEDIRWQRCDIKAITLLSNVIMRQHAMDEDAAEAILVRDGMVTEGAASNVFMIKDGTIITPPKTEMLLSGVTRDLVLELARANRMPVEERDIPFEELEQADEIWLTSSTKEVLPVTVLDHQIIGKGTPGPVWQKMIQIYQDCKAKLRQG
jgi:D-alanine transaminase